MNGSETFKSDPNAFILSLTNKDNTPLKIKIHLDKHHRAIQYNLSYGPIFGGCDIALADDANNTTMNSYTNLGWTYKHPQYTYGTNKAKTFLAASFKFQLDEIEVYQKEE